MDTPGSTRTVANLPAVIGAIVVAMALVIAWVVTSNMGSDQVAISGTTTGSSTSIASTSTAASTTSAPPSTVPDPTRVPASVTTTPPPMPATVPGRRPAATTTTTTAKPPSATVAGPSPTQPRVQPPEPDKASPSEDGAGDLNIEGHQIQQPACDGGYITILGSVSSSSVSPGSLAQLLDKYPSSRYLRTDLSCKSLALSSDGSGLYVLYFGPFPTPEAACAARSSGPPSAYVRRLFNDGDESSGAGCG